MTLNQFSVRNDNMSEGKVAEQRKDKKRRNQAEIEPNTSNKRKRSTAII